MADKARRLHFTEDELSDRDIRRAAKKADKAADKADRANEKLPTKRRVRIIRDSGRAEAVDERLSDKLHQSRQSSKADREKEKAPSKRKPRTTARSGKVEATAERLSDKLRRSPQSTIAARGKLRIEVTEVTAQKPGAGGRAAVNAPAAALYAARNTVRDAVGRSDDDGEGNSGADALQSGESTVRNAGNVVNNRHYSHKLKQYDKAARLERKSDSANVEALYQRERHNSPNHSSNPISKWRQKQELKKRYMEAKASGKAGASGAAKGGKKATEGTKSLVDKGIEFVKEHPKAILIAGVLGLLIMLIAGMFSSCTAMFAGSGNAVLGTSYTAEDADIIGADADYSALETALNHQISNIESTHPGYDEYRYDLAEIGHNPYELASYLTVLFEDYTRAEVQSTLQSLFAQQYTLTLTPEVEVRYRTETRTDSEGNDYDVEVPYNYHILNVKLTNKGLGAVIRASGLTTEQADRYDVLMTTSGNRSELFGEDVYGVSGGEYTDYDIPGEALTDERFRRMITEAEKYLGYPYVWGGSNPSTSFDCSGFVSWVINHSGNGWSVGRLGAKGLKGICDIIPPDQAKPGDLIFFHHTYDAPDPSDATHVGIYVGDGMMIHCGNPISYASTESNYWQNHFLCFGRIR
ncbi:MULTISPECIES: C40 family peptidase [Clostridia]|uniref:NlpC/P60 family protein n=3 Tax=Clostridia TaxID=186801 RepID=A0A1I0D3N5_9FIRM|nr:MULTISPECIES: C40 family peptidase [Clostridia]MSS36246.1 NlpC/P60 family protein [Clostridium porci]MSS89459.1 NlpC/P60 family protein [Eisenbergiella porci]SET26537.1 NlpC/P60 family protein [Enterocloster clostridioformis]SEV95566.1 NlpC/P60 family protein [Enterocloster clostridioformis]